MYKGQGWKEWMDEQMDGWRVELDEWIHCGYIFLTNRSIKFPALWILWCCMMSSSRLAHKHRRDEPWMCARKRLRFGCKRDSPNDGVLVHSQKRLTGWSGVCGRVLRPLRDQSVAGKFCKSSFQLPGASGWGRRWWWWRWWRRRRRRRRRWWWWWWCDPLKDIILYMTIAKSEENCQ